MERRLMFFERLMHARGECCICFLALSLGGPIEEAAIRAALDRLRDLHLMLRVDIAARDGIPWFVTPATQRPIPLRIVARLDADTWRAALDADLNIGFPGGAGPLFRVVWVRGADVSEMIFICHHCIGDGLAATMLARKMLNLALRPDVVVTGDDGIAGLDDLLAPDVARVPATIARARRLSRAMRVALPLVDMVLRRGKGVREPNRFYGCQLDIETSRRLRAEARARDVPLFGLFGAALARAFKEARGPKARRRIVCAVDLRAGLPLLGRQAMFAIADSVTIAVPAASDIWEEAREFANALVDASKALDIPARLLAGEMSHTASDALLGVVTKGGSRHDFVFAYLGTPLVPALEAPYRFNRLLAGGASMPWRNSTTISCLTVKGNFEIVMIARPPALPVATANAVIAAFPAIMASALGTPARP